MGNADEAAKVAEHFELRDIPDKFLANDSTRTRMFAFNCNCVQGGCFYHRHLFWDFKTTSGE